MPPCKVGGGDNACLEFKVIKGATAIRCIDVSLVFSFLKLSAVSFPSPSCHKSGLFNHSSGLTASVVECDGCLTMHRSIVPWFRTGSGK